MAEETPIEAIINAGVKRVKVDGTETEFQSPAELNKQKRRADATANTRRPVVSTINLSGS